MLKPMEIITRSGLFGPWDIARPRATTQKAAGINPAGCDPWGLDSFQIFPNFVILVWGQSWYLTYHYWPTSHNTHVFEGHALLRPAEDGPRAAWRRRSRPSPSRSTGCRTPTRSRPRSPCSSRACWSVFPLNDQEVLCRHLHKVAAEWVDDYTKLQTAEV